MTGANHPRRLAIALHRAPAEDPGMLIGTARQESGLETMTLRDNRRADHHFRTQPAL